MSNINCNNNSLNPPSSSLEGNLVPTVFDAITPALHQKILSYLPFQDLCRCLLVNKKSWTPIVRQTLTQITHTAMARIVYTLLWKDKELPPPLELLEIEDQKQLYYALEDAHEGFIKFLEVENASISLPFPKLEPENELFAEWVEKKYIPFTRKRDQLELYQKFAEGDIVTLELCDFTYIPPFGGTFEVLDISNLQSHIKHSAEALTNPDLAIDALILSDMPYSLLSPFPENILDHLKFELWMYKCELNNTRLLEFIKKFAQKKINHPLNVKENININIKPCSEEDIHLFAQAWKNHTWTPQEKEKVDLWLLLHAATGSSPTTIELDESQMPDNAQCGIQDWGLIFRGASEVCRKNHGYVYNLPQKTWNAIFGDLSDPTAYDFLPPKGEDQTIKKLKIEAPPSGL